MAEDAQGRSLLPRTRKTRALFAVLAVASPKPVQRITLASLLWSRRETEQSRASLRQSVHELQETLGVTCQHVFLADRHHLSLRAAALDTDIHPLLHPQDISAHLLDGFKERLLEDLDGLDPAFDHWLADERAKLFRMARSIGESVLARCDSPSSIIDAAERLLSLDPRHEGAWRAAIRGHAERGDNDVALAMVDRFRCVMADAPDVRLSAESEDLIERIRTQSWLAMGVRSRTAVFASIPPESRSSPAPSDRPSPLRDPSNLRLRVSQLRVLGNENDNGLSAGLAEEFSAGLSRFRWISCVLGGPWSSSGPDWDDKRSAAAIADLVLDGTVQRAGERVRVIVRLIDLRNGSEIVWAGRFDRDWVDTLALQDELGATIVAQVDPELMRHEGRRIAAAQLPELTARELLLQALPAIYRLDQQSFLAARRLLEMSLAADPESSVAHGWLAYWYLLYVGQGWSENPQESTVLAGRLAERAVALDPHDARALTLAGHVRGFLARRPHEACALHDRAIALNPNLALAWCFSGLANSYLGQHQEALRRIQQAVKLSPADPHGFFFDMALVMPLLLLGDYAAAVIAGRRAVEMNPQLSSSYKGYLSALGWLGRTQEAADARERLLLLEPAFTVQSAKARSPLTRAEDIAIYIEGLRRAGLPLGDDGPVVSNPMSEIDLVSTGQHSPPAVRNDSHAAGRA